MPVYLPIYMRYEYAENSHVDHVAVQQFSSKSSSFLYFSFLFLAAFSFDSFIFHSKLCRCQSAEENDENAFILGQYLWMNMMCVCVWFVLYNNDTEKRKYVDWMPNQSLSRPPAARMMMLLFFCVPTYATRTTHIVINFVRRNTDVWSECISIVGLGSQVIFQFLERFFFFLLFGANKQMWDEWNIKWQFYCAIREDCGGWNICWWDGRYEGFRGINTRLWLTIISMDK